MKSKFVNIHPLFYAVFPILALRNYNINYVDLGSITRSLIISLFIACTLWATLTFITKNSDRAGLLTTLTMILFFSYGHVYLQLKAVTGVAIHHRQILLAFGVLFIILSILILRSKNSASLKQLLALTGIVMITLNVAQSAGHDINTYRTNTQARNKFEQTATPVNDGKKSALPDIYLIILDAHTRSDFLEEKYNFDNTEFIRGLEDLGFYVAHCSQSNYAFTNYSLTSMMFMDYLHNFTDMIALPGISESTVNQTLRSLGYLTIRFENSVGGHLVIDEDILLSRDKLSLGNFDLTGGPNEFEAELFQTTFLKFFYDLPQFLPGFDPVRLEQTEHYEHYLQTRHILAELKNVPSMRGPKFVFVHILVPHTPYIFTPAGEFDPTTDPISGYRNNVKFIDSHILPALNDIISRSDVPPIIIIQGDHGPIGKKISPEMRMAILNAYYVNAETKTALYNTITPVNSFRVIFNHYLGYQLPLLDDASYYSLKPSAFNLLQVVPNDCQ